MTILITGGAGFIGSHMILDLIDHGHNVVTIDNLSTGNEWIIPGGAEFINGDIGDRELVAKALRDHSVSAIIHFAGSIIVPESVSDPLAYYHNNTVKSHALIEEAIKAGVKQFIFSSTAAVYGTPGMEPVKEVAPLKPESPYGNSKLMTEIMLHDACNVNDMTYGILRYFNVAGADPDQRSGQSSKNTTHLIKIACEVAIGEREKLTIYGDDYETPDGTCVRDYIHVSDLTDAHRLTLEYLRDAGTSITLNCGYGRGFSVKEVIEQVGKSAGVEINAEQGSRRDGDPAVVIADSTKAKNLLQWRPQHDDLSQITDHALTWQKKLARRNH